MGQIYKNMCMLAQDLLLKGFDLFYANKEICCNASLGQGALIQLNETTPRTYN